MNTRITLMISIVVLAIVSFGCAARRQSSSSNAFEYLYPEGSDGTPAETVSLELPLRVGVAFAPGTTINSTFSEAHKSELLERIADAFRDQEIVERIDVIPGHYLTKAGGFEELDRLKTAFGIDLVALVSYDQLQFSDPGISALTYWTVVGGYIVKGDKQDTVTVMDAAVFDIESKALLFRAAGESTIKNRATANGVERAWRKASSAGFADATVSLVTNLDQSLAVFTEQAATGTVRGRGTPQLRITTAPGYQGGLGGGASGWIEIAGMLALISFGLILRR